MLAVLVVDLLHLQRVALGKLRQTYVFASRFGVAILVPALFVSSQEAAVGNDRAGGRESGFTLGRVGLDAHGSCLPASIIHLRGHSALPDQVVKTQFRTADLPGHLVWGTEVGTRWADSFVSLLRALGFGCVKARLGGNRGGSVQLAGLFAGRSNRL